MILSNNLALVCLSIALYAVCDSFASGSGEALAYDSLKSAGQEQVYDRYESTQLIIYRLCSGISTLCAGFALIIGYRIAYATGIITCLIQLFLLFSLEEVRPDNARSASVSAPNALLNCFRDSLRFLKKETRAFLLMMTNSLIGAADILLLFFLQAKLPAAGIPDQWLGPALFVMQLGGIIGARIILRFKKKSYRTIFAVTGILVLAGIGLEHSGIPLLMTAGGFIAALADDALQVRTNTRLQDMFPSERSFAAGRMVLLLLVIRLRPAGQFLSQKVLQTKTPLSGGALHPQNRLRAPLSFAVHCASGFFFPIPPG